MKERSRKYEWLYLNGKRLFDVLSVSDEGQYLLIKQIKESRKRKNACPNKL